MATFNGYLWFSGLSRDLAPLEVNKIVLQWHILILLLSKAQCLLKETNCYCSFFQTVDRHYDKLS